VEYASIKDIMTSPVLTVPEDWTLEQLAKFFVDHGVTGAPVTSVSGDVIGVVSSTDIVRHDSLPLTDDGPHDTHEYYLSSIGRQYSADEMASFRIEGEASVTVRDLMTPMLFQVDEHDSVQEVADMMIKGNIHRVLVTRDRKVVGIVAAMDMLKIVRDL
jgi:predicted transcriptional regulator